MRALIGYIAFLVIVLPPVAAQDLTAGASLGIVKLTDTRSEQALTGTLAYQAGWFSLYASPAFLRVAKDSAGRTVSSSGLGDLPLTAAASYTSPTPGSPTVGASLLVVLPTGNASCGLGSGQTAAGFDVGAGVSPGLAHFWGDASRSLSGVSSQSSLNAPKATTIHLEAGYEVSPGWTWTGSVGFDVGTVDSTQALSRVIGLGASHTLAGPLMLTVDGAHGLTTGSPKWVLAVGVGTAYGGSSPVTPTTPLRRLGTTFRTSGTRTVSCR
jgi:hypothetical protein